MRNFLQRREPPPPSEIMLDRWRAAQNMPPPVNQRPGWLDGATVQEPGEYPYFFLARASDGREVRALIRTAPCLIRGRVVAVERDRFMPDFVVNVGLALSGFASLPFMWRLATPRQVYLEQDDGLVARALAWSFSPVGLLAGLIRRSQFLHIHLFRDWSENRAALDRLQQLGEVVEIKAAVAALAAVDMETGEHEILFQETDECWCAYPLTIRSEHGDEE